AGDHLALPLERPLLVQREPDPGRQPLHEIGGGQPRVEVRIEAVERDEQRRRQLVERGAQALGEVVFLVEAWERQPDGMGDLEFIDDSAQNPPYLLDPGWDRITTVSGAFHEDLVLVWEHECVWPDLDSLDGL